MVEKKIILKLYVSGQTLNSIKAIHNLKKILSGELKDMYELEVINVLENPQLAEDEKIMATPTLSRSLPLPIKRIIGDLSDKEKVLIGLDIVEVGNKWL